MKKNQGITLIALVITIIILLILAGVALSVTMGDNGIFKIAKQAGEETNKQAAIEKMSLKITNIQMISYANKKEMPTLQELADNLCEDNEIEYVNLEKQKTAAVNDKIIVGENTAIYTKLEEYPYEFKINSKLEIVSLDGVEIEDATGTTNTENKGEIPEGYIKPSGIKEITANGEHDVTTYEKVNVNVPTYEANSTLSITEKNNKIDVSNYQYADTTGLYTKEEAQSGKGVYWEKTSVTIPENASILEVDLGFSPSFVFLDASSSVGDISRWWSVNSCTTSEMWLKNHDGALIATQYTDDTNQGLKLIGTKLIISFATSGKWNGRTVNIYAIK